MDNVPRGTSKRNVQKPSRKSGRGRRELMERSFERNYRNVRIHRLQTRKLLRLGQAFEPDSHRTTIVMIWESGRRSVVSKHRAYKH